MSAVRSLPACLRSAAEAGGVLDRRSFLGDTAKLAVLSALAAACSDVGSPTSVGLGQDVLVQLADYPELAQVGGVARIAGVSPPLAVVNLGGGTFAAFSLVCPHQGATVRWVGSEFVCPEHGARFSIDGRWTGGQRTSSLREYAATYDDVAGTVIISAG
ncbi:MAG: Rieske (2Fe-2S) protein [Gemmatimonadota bacterium]